MRTILTAALCAITFICSAQKNFKKGFIVNNASDTIKGYINYVEQSKNPASILFKKNSEDPDAKKYTVHDIQYFEIEGFEYYTRYVCKISMDQTHPSYLAIGEDTTNIIDTVLLRSIFQGSRIQLFSYTDNIKTRFYIKKTLDKTPVELIYKTYYDAQNQSVIREIKIFHAQLLDYAQEFNVINSSLKSSIAKSTYIKSYITKLVKIIDGGSGEKFENAAKNKTHRIAVYGGLNKSDYRFSGDILNENLKFSTHYSPVVGIGIDYFFNPSIGRLIFRPEVSLTINKFYGSENKTTAYYYYEYKLKRYTLTSNFSFLYNCYNTENLKLFIGGGLAVNISANSENSYSRKYVTGDGKIELSPYKYKNISTDIVGRAGMVWQNKFEISLVGNIPLTGTTDDYVNFHDIHNYQQIRFGYLLSNKKK